MSEIKIIEINDFKEETHKKRGKVCILSPIIFNAYIQEVINIIREKTYCGVKLNG